MLNRFKNWLKDPDMKYLYGKYTGEPMIDSLNPFCVVVEDSQYPLARIARQSFWDGMFDTYGVFVGNHYDLLQTKKTYKGFLDIFIFPSISRRAMYYYHSKDRNRVLGW